MSGRLSALDPRHSIFLLFFFVIFNFFDFFDFFFCLVRYDWAKYCQGEKRETKAKTKVCWTA